MTNGTKPEPRPRPQRGYPLSLLFLLTAFCAVLAAMVALAMRTQPVFHAVRVTLLSGAVGFLLGSFIGLWHYRPLIGAAIGAPMGTILGGLAGAIWGVDEQTFPLLFLLQSIGAVVVVVMAVSWSNGHRIEPSDYEDLLAGENPCDLSSLQIEREG